MNAFARGEETIADRPAVAHSLAVAAVWADAPSSARLLAVRRPPLIRVA
jgi:hypothetical protein